MIEAIRKIRRIHGPKTPPVTTADMQYVLDIWGQATICGVCLALHPCETYRATM